MGWAIGTMLAIGLVYYFILAAMGAGKESNMRGARLKILLACLIWPVTLLCLLAYLVYIWLFPQRDTPALQSFARSLLGV